MEKGLTGKNKFAKFHRPRFWRGSKKFFEMTESKRKYRVVYILNHAYSVNKKLSIIFILNTFCNLLIER